MSINEQVSHGKLFIPAKYRKLFLQYIFGEKQHPSAVAYLGVDKVKLFDMLSSLHFLQLYQLVVQASNHSQAREPKQLEMSHLCQIPTKRKKSFDVGILNWKV